MAFGTLFEGVLSVEQDGQDVYIYDFMTGDVVAQAHFESEPMARAVSVEIYKGLSSIEAMITKLDKVAERYDFEHPEH